MTGSSKKPFTRPASLGQWHQQMAFAARRMAAVHQVALEIGAEVFQDEIILPAGYSAEAFEQRMKELGW